MTYRALDRRANQLAHRLRGLGVGLDRIVAICLERSPEMVVAVLGVLKAGAAYVPHRGRVGPVAVDCHQGEESRLGNEVISWRF